MAKKKKDPFDFILEEGEEPTPTADDKKKKDPFDFILEEEPAPEVDPEERFGKDFQVEPISSLADLRAGEIEKKEREKEGIRQEFRDRATEATEITRFQTLTPLQQKAIKDKFRMSQLAEKEAAERAETISEFDPEVQEQIRQADIELATRESQEEAQEPLRRLEAAQPTLGSMAARAGIGSGRTGLKFLEFVVGAPARALRTAVAGEFGDIPASVFDPDRAATPEQAADTIRKASVGGFNVLNVFVPSAVLKLISGGSPEEQEAIKAIENEFAGLILDPAFVTKFRMLTKLGESRKRAGFRMAQRIMQMNGRVDFNDKKMQSIMKTFITEAGLDVPANREEFVKQMQDIMVNRMRATGTPGLAKTFAERVSLGEQGVMSILGWNILGERSARILSNLGQAADKMTRFRHGIFGFMLGPNKENLASVLRTSGRELEAEELAKFQSKLESIDANMVKHGIVSEDERDLVRAYAENIRIGPVGQVKQLQARKEFSKISKRLSQFDKNKRLAIMSAGEDVRRFGDDLLSALRDRGVEVDMLGQRLFDKVVKHKDKLSKLEQDRLSFIQDNLRRSKNRLDMMMDIRSREKALSSMEGQAQWLRRKKDRELILKKADEFPKALDDLNQLKEGAFDLDNMIIGLENELRIAQSQNDQIIKKLTDKFIRDRIVFEGKEPVAKSLQKQLVKEERRLRGRGVGRAGERRRTISRQEIREELDDIMDKRELDEIVANLPSQMRVEDLQDGLDVILSRRQAIQRAEDAVEELVQFRKNADVILERQGLLDDVKELRKVAGAKTLTGSSLDDRIGLLEMRIKELKGEVAAGTTSKRLLNMNRKIADVEGKLKKSIALRERAPSWVALIATDPAIEEMLKSKEIRKLFNDGRFVNAMERTFQDKNGVPLSVGDVKRLLKKKKLATSTRPTLGSATMGEIKDLFGSVFSKDKTFNDAWKEVSKKQMARGGKGIISDPIGAMFQASSRAARAIGQTDATKQMAKFWGRPLKTKKVTGSKGEPGEWTDVTDLAPAFNFGREADGTVKRMMMPNEVSEEVARQLRAAKDPLMPGAIAKNLVPWIRFWKMSQTAILPGFHIRNKISNLFRRFQEGGLDVGAGNMMKLWGPNGAYWRLLRRGSKNPDDFKDVILDLGPMGQVPMSQALRIAQRDGIIGNGIWSFEFSPLVRKEFRTLGNAIPEFALNSAAAKAVRNWTSWVEDTDRLGHWFARLRQGDPWSLAKQSVNTTLFNPRDIGRGTQFLRDSGVAPFAAWSMQNFPAQLELLFRKPASFAAMIRLKEMLANRTVPVPEDRMPEWVKKKTNLVIRHNKETNDWDVVTLSGVFPVADLNDFGDPLNPVDSFTEFWSQQLGPVPTVIAAALQFDVQRMEKIDDANRAADIIRIPAFPQFSINRSTRKIMNAVPFSRLFNVASKIGERMETKGEGFLSAFGKEITQAGATSTALIGFGATRKVGGKETGLGINAGKIKGEIRRLQSSIKFNRIRLRKATTDERRELITEDINRLVTRQAELKARLRKLGVR